MYDLLTGEVVKELKGHRSCVRDVSWHPTKPEIISSSVRRQHFQTQESFTSKLCLQWDFTLARWHYCPEEVSQEASAHHKETLAQGRRCPTAPLQGRQKLPAQQRPLVSVRDADMWD